MSNSAAQAYTRVANATASPRDTEAQALMMAANKLQEVVTNTSLPAERVTHALMFNRKLWTLFLSEALRDESPQPLDVRQKIVNISMFVLSHTMALQVSPQREHIKPLIDINRNIAAGLSGRA
ncbi:MAG: flagellar biosynthesis regulator FlaF [Xanthobacteraceae bacterium]